ncbi:C2 domain-containing protein [Citrus sinensis]|nr:C2 domain-containing protein [Citrus sinensis]
MTKYRDEDGNEKAECNYCKKTFDASSKKGTTHLKNHSDRCRAKGKEAGADKDKSEIARDQEEKEMKEVQEQNIGSSSSERPRRSKRCRAQRKGGGDEDKTIKTGDFATTVVIKGKCRIDQINHSIDAEGFTTEHCDPSILKPIKVMPMESLQTVVSVVKSSVIAEPDNHKSDFFAPSGNLETEANRLEIVAPNLENFSGVLEVYMHRARDIHNISIYYKQDVYAKLCLTSDAENTVATKIIYGGGRNPVFNENCQLDVKTVDSSLKCEIFMMSRITSYLEDQFLGFTLVPLSEVLINNGKLEKEFSLSSTDFVHSPAGLVQLSLPYATYSPEVMAIPTVPKPLAADETAQNQK